MWGTQQVHPHLRAGGTAGFGSSFKDDGLYTAAMDVTGSDIEGEQRVMPWHDPIPPMCCWSSGRRARHEGAYGRRS
jgi:hypothetical protein